MENLNLKTNDGIKIAANYYPARSDTIVIVAPGWCMTKDSDAFLKISEYFNEKYAVLTLDFRGHGKSKGWFTFMTKELKDLDIATKTSFKLGYKNIILAGFSLGAGLAIIYAARHNDIKGVIAVSAPSDFDKIENKMWKKEAWGETFKKFEIKRFLSIRPYPIPLKKIKPIDAIKHLKCPTLFIAGEKDPTVCAWHTEKLYNLANCPKEYMLFKDGCHAEDLYLNTPEAFREVCDKWLLNL